jgi:molybdate transport system regulatory protein
MAKRRLQTHLEVETEAGAVLGSARIRLLEAVEKFGSISKAAQRLPMSYKAAWDALDDLNNLADFPVVERRLGGAGGGGTRLTD